MNPRPACADGDPASVQAQLVTDSDGLPHVQLLTLPGVSEACYHIEMATRLDGSNVWTTVDRVCAASNGPVVWTAPWPLRQQEFFHVRLPQPQIFAVEPAIAPPNAPVTLYLTGQCFGSNDTVRLNGGVIPGAGIVSSALAQLPVPPQPPGVHRVELVRDGVVLSFFDVFFFDPGSDPFISLQEPPTLPPGAPVAALKHRGHVTVLKSHDDGHVTVLKGRARGHVTVLKSHGGDSDFDQDGDGQDCLPHSGEVLFQETDLAIPGRGLDFVWTRTYRSRIGGDSPMGQGWTHAYDIRCAPNGQDMDVWDGTGRRDTLRRGECASGVCAFSAPGLFREGALSNDVFRLTFADSGFWEFLPLDGTSAAGKIARSVDRNGNTLRFEYDASGRLLRVIDTLDRTNTLAYDPNGRLVSLTDFSGRRVSYTYVRNAMDLSGSIGDLKSVTSPPVTGTSNGNDFPTGKTTTYTYTRGFADDRLNHNLLVAYDALGQPQVELAYASTEDPTAFDFDAVQTVLRGTNRLDLQREPLTPSPANDFATVRCVINDFVGNVTEEYYDARHRLVRRLEFTGRANPAEPTTSALNRPTNKLRADDPDVFESRWSWNNDSLCTAWQRPQTNRVEWLYQADLEPATPPRLRANLRVERTIGDVNGDGLPDVVVASFEHDPRFGTSEAAAVSLGQTGAAGPQFNNAGFYSLDDFVSTRTIPPSFVSRILNPRGFETRCEYDAHGNLLTRTHHGRLLGADDAPVLARENFEYNAFGQLTAHLHAEDAEGRRRRDESTYYASGPQRGYLQQSVVDAGPVGRNLTTAYEYDARGNVTRITDPRGTPTDIEVNALNQTVSKQTQGATFGELVRRTFFYDANNKTIRVDIENRDGDGNLNPTNAWLTTLYEYDPLNRLSRLMEEEGISYSYLTNEFAYDGNDQLVLARSPAAVHGLDPFHVTQTAYDERGLLFRETRAPGSPAQSTTQYDYDGNGNLRATRAGLEAATGPRVTEYAYDGLDRRIRETDAMGNETRYEYDLNGNVTRATSYGETNDVPGSAGNRRFAETRYEYDALDRCVRFRPAFFDIFTELPLGDGFQDNTITYAPNGLVTRTTNDRGFALRYAYDTAGRLIRETDAKTNRVEYTYDANGNLLSATQTGRSDVGGPDEVFVKHFSYDALNRCVADWDNVGNTNRYAYDSRGNLVRHTDPRGIVLQGDYDGLSRPTSNRKGVGGSAQQTTHYTWDAASRLVAVTDGNSNVTQYAYDSLNRLIRTTLADNTSTTNAYDARGNLVWTRDANGTQITSLFDALDRCVQKNIKPGPGVAGSTTRETCQYDGLSRPVNVANNHTEVTFAYDSLGRCVAEATASPALGLPLAQTRWTIDAAGLTLAQTNPSGRVIEYTYDALDRPVSLGWRAGAGLPFQSLGTLGYVGPADAARITRANGIQTDYTRSGVSGAANPPGDFGWGQIQRVRHAVGGTTPVIDERLFAHDRNQNKTLRALTVPFIPGAQTNRQTFQYDSLDRLVQSVKTVDGLPVQDAGYVLDPMGNRQSVISGGMDHPYLLDPTLPQPADFQVHQYTVTPFDERQYDENGNLHQTAGGDPTDPVVRTFSYDYADRLVAVQTPLGSVAQYAYDALGRRIAKVLYAGLPPVPVQTNRYLYAGGQVIEENDGSGAVLRSHVAPHVFDVKARRTFVMPHVFDMAGPLVSLSGGGEVLHHHRDDQGNLLALTDAAGNVVERFDYDDYGAPQFLDANGNPRPGATASLTGVTHLFHGMQWDEETGLHYMGCVQYRETDWNFLTVHVDLNTGSTATRTYAMPHVFDQKGRAYAGNNPWSARGRLTTVVPGVSPRPSATSPSPPPPPRPVIVPDDRRPTQADHAERDPAGGHRSAGGAGVDTPLPQGVTVPKQTQGATFGEKVNAGLHATGGALAQGVGLRFRPAFFDIFTEFNDLRPHPSSSSSSSAVGASGFTPGSGISINPGRAADVLAHEAAHVAQQRGGVSNVLKTKHDTVKNSINNVR
ncbi:MAG: DUF4157 domain-containing protein [Verrucomicrobia bacterium]|nr:DUF4157 domain-containing protein [Verrucomicrobiota bacterium]